MHFVFTAPRFHTNQHFPAKALLDAGHRVTFPVLRRGQSATDEVLARSVLGCSRSFDVLRHTAAWLPGVRFSDVGGLPSPIRFLAAALTVNIVAIGKFQRRKSHELFLDAIAETARHHPVRALIVGECTTDEHREVLRVVSERRAGLGLQDIVEIRTNMPFTDVQRLYAEHDLFVLASQGEPAAVSPLEAMARSLPVICSDSNGTACYVLPGRTGFVSRSGDATHLATCIGEAIQDQDRLIEDGPGKLPASAHGPSTVTLRQCPRRHGDPVVTTRVAVYLPSLEGRWRGTGDGRSRQRPALARACRPTSSSSAMKGRGGNCSRPTCG